MFSQVWYGPIKRLYVCLDEFEYIFLLSLLTVSNILPNRRLPKKEFVVGAGSLNKLLKKPEMGQDEEETTIKTLDTENPETRFIETC